MAGLLTLVTTKFIKDVLNEEECGKRDVTEISRNQQTMKHFMEKRKPNTIKIQ